MSKKDSRKKIQRKQNEGNNDKLDINETNERINKPKDGSWQGLN